MEKLLNIVSDLENTMGYFNALIESPQPSLSTAIEYTCTKFGVDSSSSC